MAPMKTILVPIEQHSTLPSVLETALLVGRSLEGYIEGFALGPNFRNLITVDAVIAPPILDETAQREMVETARQRFETFMRAHAVPEARNEPDGLSFDWLGTPSKMTRSLATTVGRSTSSSWAAPDRAAMAHAPAA